VIVGLDDVAESLSQVFSAQITAQFDRSSIFERFFDPVVVRAVAEEETGVFCPPVKQISWDTSFGA